MKKYIVKILGSFLFFVFFCGIMPKEYIHDALFDHEDEVHPVYKKGEVVITKKHNHCSFLSFEFVPFVATETQIISFRKPVIYSESLPSGYTCQYFAGIRSVQSRGPPFCRV